LTESLETKTVLITGASNGIGRALSFELATKGAQLCVCGRNEQKLTQLCDDIVKATGNRSISMYVADQRRLDDVKQLAADLTQLEKIDVLVNNAGVCPGKRVVNDDGLEQAFVVNYLSHVYLTYLLLDKLKAADQGRIVQVSSLAFGNGQLDFSNLQGERYFDGWQAYSNSKLFIILFSMILARLLEGTHVTTNAVCPGIVDTGLLVDNPLFTPQRLASLKPAMQAPKKACELLNYLISEPSLSQVNGQFFSRGYGGFQPVPINVDEQSAKELWAYTRTMLTSLCPDSTPFPDVVV